MSETTGLILAFTASFVVSFTVTFALVTWMAKRWWFK